MCSECEWEQVVASIESLVSQIGDAECSTVPRETAEWALATLAGLTAKIEENHHVTDEDGEEIELVETEIGMFL